MSGLFLTNLLVYHFPYFDLAFKSFYFEYLNIGTKNISKIQNLGIFYNLLCIAIAFFPSVCALKKIILKYFLKLLQFPVNGFIFYMNLFFIYYSFQVSTSESSLCRKLLSFLFCSSLIFP